MHGATVSCTWPHDWAAFAKGASKTKHSTTKQVIVELAIDCFVIQFNCVSEGEVVDVFVKDYLGGDKVL
uniref:hypothetical protein n=1 Tax=Klebsiella pneumoniae TaxID=573 RepID=UPI001C60A7D5